LPRRDTSGPIAILGPGVQPRTVNSPASLFDVYPTLVEMTGSPDPARPIRAPAAGTSLLSPERPPRALTGRLGDELELVARGGGEAIRYLTDRREFLRVTSSKGESLRIAHDGSLAGDSAALLALLRDGFWAGRWRERQSRLAKATAGPYPVADDAPVASFERGFEVLGCSDHRTAGDRLEIGVGLRGGEHLLPGDAMLFELRLKRKGNEWVRLEPLDGGLRFGEWRPGQVIVQRLSFQVDPGFRGSIDLMLAVTRGGERIEVTGGAEPRKGLVVACSLLQRGSR
jgi:hypothetical protein